MPQSTRLYLISIILAKLKFVFKNRPTPASFSFYCCLFQTNNTICTTNQCEKCPSSIRCRDLNPRPLELEPLDQGSRPKLNFVPDWEKTLLFLKHNDLYDTMQTITHIPQNFFFNNRPNSASFRLFSFFSMVICSIDGIRARVPAYFPVYFRLFNMSQFNLNKVCLVFKPRAAGWKVQMNPLRYSVTRMTSLV